MDVGKKIDELKVRILRLMKDAQAGKEISNEMDDLKAEVDRLRQYLEERGIDPDTGKPLKS